MSNESKIFNINYDGPPEDKGKWIREVRKLYMKNASIFDASITNQAISYKYPDGTTIRCQSIKGPIGNINLAQVVVASQPKLAVKQEVVRMIIPVIDLSDGTYYDDYLVNAVGTLTFNPEFKTPTLQTMWKASDKQPAMDINYVNPSAVGPKLHVTTKTLNQVNEYLQLSEMDYDTSQTAFKKDNAVVSTYFTEYPVTGNNVSGAVYSWAIMVNGKIVINPLISKIDMTHTAPYGIPTPCILNTAIQSGTDIQWNPSVFDAISKDGSCYAFLYSLCTYNVATVTTLASESNWAWTYSGKVHIECHFYCFGPKGSHDFIVDSFDFSTFPSGSTTHALDYSTYFDPPQLMNNSCVRIFNLGPKQTPTPIFVYGYQLDPTNYYNKNHARYGIVVNNTHNESDVFPVTNLNPADVDITTLCVIPHVKYGLYGSGYIRAATLTQTTEVSNG